MDALHDRRRFVQIKLNSPVSPWTFIRVKEIWGKICRENEI
jgi:hypothetical protein